MKLIDPNDIPFHSAPIAPLYPNGHLVDYEWHVSYEWVAYQHDIERIMRIEAELVVHAHWIKGAFRTITCSNCGFLLRVPDAIIPKFAYCPHCGAKMDEVEKNDKRRSNICIE